MRSRRRRKWFRSKASNVEAQFSGSGNGARDPVRLGEALATTASQKGWSGAMAEGTIVSQWPFLVGAEIAAHVHPEAYLAQTRELVLVADSPAWATQIKLLQRQMITRINEHFGSKRVAKLVIRTHAGGQRRAYRRGSSLT